MLKKRHGPIGTAPATLIPHLIDGVRLSSSIRIVEYQREQYLDKTSTTIEEIEFPLPSDRVTWIHLVGLGDIALLRSLGNQLNIHPLTLEDVVNTGQRPKIEITADYIFLCSQAVSLDAELTPSSEQISIFLGKNYVLTIAERDQYDYFKPVRERIFSGLGNIRSSQADYLAYALLDTLIDHFYSIIEHVGERMESLEDSLLKDPSSNIARVMHEDRRSLIYIRRLIWPLRDILDDLLHEADEFISPKVKIYLRDCYDHTIQLMDLVESQREISSSMMEMYHSSVNMRTNEIMRVLTVITSIFIPLTFIVGIYGMNFENKAADGSTLAWNMPELHHPYGYLGVIIFMLLIAIIQLIFFRKMKWL